MICEHEPYKLPSGSDYCLMSFAMADEKIRLNSRICRKCKVVYVEETPYTPPKPHEYPCQLAFEPTPMPVYFPKCSCGAASST